MAIASLNFSAPLSATAGVVFVGQCLVPLADGTYVVATAANRATYGRADGIAATTGDNRNPCVLLTTGPIPNAITGLGPGAASWIRVSSAGILERCTPSTGDDIVGWGETDGRLHADFGILTAAIVSGSVVILAPTVTSLSVATGPTTGSTATTINGTNLTGASAVTFGGVAATSVVVVNSTTITCVSPAGSAGAVTVAVTTSGGTGSLVSAFTYVAVVVPTVSAISKALGPSEGGQPVTLTGTNFTSATSAAIGGTNLTSFVVVNATTITGITAAHATATLQSVTVTGPGGTGTLASAYEFWSPLSLTNCAVWYDIAKGTVTAGKLTALLDQSGNARNATLLNGAGTGLTVTTANAGYASSQTVHRTDATDSLTSPDLGITAGPLTTVFVGNCSTAGTTFMMRATTNTADLAQVSALPSETADGGTTRLSGTGTLTTPSIVIGVLNAASSRVYGTAATATSGGSGIITSLTGAGVRIGDAAASGNGDVDIRHSLVFSRALTDTECKYLLRGFGVLNGISIGA